MSTRSDTLPDAQTPDRVFYATGVMLDAGDFQAEQDYHRGRLARALAFLYGSGTIAGLNVEWTLTTAEDGTQTEQLTVCPGLCLDRLGRLIELPREACIRLDRWYEAQATSSDPQVVEALNTALKGTPYDGVVADVFVRYVPCEIGKTPAFASGPFDALDAVQPSRLRDGYELQLILRGEADPSVAVPDQNWPDFSGAADAAARKLRLEDAILGAWPADGATDPSLSEFSEYAADQEDKTAVFLARVVLRATASGTPGQPPERPGPLVDTGPDPSVTVDNHLRLFVYMPRALARAMEL